MNDWRDDPAFLREEARRQATLATGAMREADALRAVATAVIAAADNTYGPEWREWPKSADAGPGPLQLSRALCDLERSISGGMET